MKRPIDELTPDECSIVFERLPVERRRILLSVAHGGCTDVVVYTESAMLKDIIHIIIARIDVQTWGRIRQTCRRFRTLRHAGLDRIEKCFNEDRVFDIKKTWLRHHFRTCARRFIFYAYHLMNDYIAHFNRPPDIITGPDGRQHVFHAKTPVNFDLASGLQSLDHFMAKGNIWLKMPWGYGKVKIHCPFGFIVGTSNTAHGNIFTEDWKDVITIEADRPYMKSFGKMTKSQRERYKMQQQQFAKLIQGF